MNRLGIRRPPASNLTALSLQIAHQVQTNGLPASALASERPQVGGLANDLNGKDAQSVSIMTNLNSADTSNFRDVMLMADADGREDLVANHAAKLADASCQPDREQCRSLRLAGRTH